MSEPPLHTWRDALEARFGATRTFVVYEATQSTQDAARRLLPAGPAASVQGAVVVAGSQSQGRGRLGRRWVAPAGENRSLTFTYLSALHSSTIDRLSFATSVAVAQTADALLQAAGRRAVIKWPNDVYVDGRKLAGILIEVTQAHALIGVGLNVGSTAADFPAELRDTATSLAMCGASIDRLTVLLHLVDAMDRALASTDEAALLDAWRSRSGMLHRPVRLSQDGQVIEGEVIDLDPRAGLVVRRHSGEIVHLQAANTSVLD